MSAPARPASFFNALTGRDVEPPDSLREPGFLLDALAGDVQHWPCWVVDDDSRRRITLSVVEHVTEQRLVAAFVGEGVAGTITATPDASGYLRIMVAANGAEVFTGYVERIWEEYEIWPPAAAAPVDEDAPGRLGKHRTWVSLSVEGWPALAAVADSGGWLNLSQLEERGG